MMISPVHGVEVIKSDASGGGGSRRDGLRSTALEWFACRVQLTARYERVVLYPDSEAVKLK